MSMFLDSSRTLPDTKEGLGNPDMSGILLDSPTLLLSWPLTGVGRNKITFTNNPFRFLTSVKGWPKLVTSGNARLRTVTLSYCYSRPASLTPLGEH